MSALPHPDGVFDDRLRPPGEPEKRDGGRDDHGRHEGGERERPPKDAHKQDGERDGDDAEGAVSDGLSREHRDAVLSLTRTNEFHSTLASAGVLFDSSVAVSSFRDISADGDRRLLLIVT